MSAVRRNKFNHFSVGKSSGCHLMLFVSVKWLRSQASYINLPWADNPKLCLTLLFADYFKQKAPSVESSSINFHKNLFETLVRIFLRIHLYKSPLLTVSGSLIFCIILIRYKWKLQTWKCLSLKPSLKGENDRRTPSENIFLML